MMVFSPLALYTTYLGWQQYDVIFNALLQTGLAYLGFVFLGFRFLKEVLVAPAGAAKETEQALNQFLYQLAIMMMIAALFVYPAVPLEEKGLSFKPVCGIKAEETVKDRRVNNTGTTYDEAFAEVISSKVAVPIGFALLQHVTSSLTYGLMKVTPCVESLSAIRSDLIATDLPEQLNRELQAFQHQCFLPARARYLQAPPPKEKLTPILEKYNGEEDLTWPGSKVLQTFYYPSLHAKTEVASFTFAEASNAHLANDALNHKPQNGYPACDVWWQRLQENLVTSALKANNYNKPKDFSSVLDRVLSYEKHHPKTWNTALTTKEHIAQSILFDSRQTTINPIKEIANPDAGFMQAVAHQLLNIDQWLESWTLNPFKREALMQTLPIMQAMFYFFLIVLTPLVLVLSGYSARALGSLCALMIMTLWLPYLWQLVGLVENSLHDTLPHHLMTRILDNMAILFYFLAPMFLLKLSSHFGGEGGAGLANWMLAVGDETNQIANSAYNMAKKGAKFVLQQIKK